MHLKPVLEYYHIYISLKHNLIYLLDVKQLSSLLTPIPISFFHAYFYVNINVSTLVNVLFSLSILDVLYSLSKYLNAYLFYLCLLHIKVLILLIKMMIVSLVFVGRNQTKQHNTNM